MRVAPIQPVRVPGVAGWRRRTRTAGSRRRREARGEEIEDDHVLPPVDVGVEIRLLFFAGEGNFLIARPQICGHSWGGVGVCPRLHSATIPSSLARGVWEPTLSPPTADDRWLAGSKKKKTEGKERGGRVWRGDLQTDPSLLHGSCCKASRLAPLR